MRRVRNLIVEFINESLKKTKELAPYLGASRTDIHDLLSKIVRAYVLLARARRKHNLSLAIHSIWLIKRSCATICYLLFWTVDSPFRT